MNGRFSKSPNFISRCIAGEIILVPLSSNVAQIESIYTFNETGATIWGLVDGYNSLKDITTAITEMFDVSPEIAANDVSEFLSSLEQAGLISCSVEVEP